MEEREVSITLYVTDKCNLKCSYCYEKDSKKTRHTDVHTMIQTINWTIEECLKANYNTLSITFFGGEPLLNFPLIKRTVKYANENCKNKAIKTRYLIVTNGTLITDEILDFAQKNKISFQLSIDGDRETQDKYRLTNDGQGSFKFLGGEKKLSELSRYDIPFQIHMVYSSETVKNLFENINFFVRNGFTNIYSEPLLEPTLPWTEEKLAILESQYGRIGELMLKKSEDSLLKMNPLARMVKNMFLLERNPIKEKARLSSTNCMIGRSNFTIHTDGSIYPCHLFIYHNEFQDFKIGDVFGNTVNYKVVEMFRKLNPKTSSECICSSCEFVLICPHQCLARNHTLMNDIYSPFPAVCKITRKMSNVGKDIYKQLKKKKNDVRLEKLLAS